MKFTNFLRFLLVAVAAVMVFSLFACVDEPETETTTEEIENTTESSDDKKPEDSEKDTDDSESTPVGDDTESDNVTCAHAETQINDKCEKVCTACGEVLETAQHTKGEPSADDHCNVKCTVCGEVLEENKHGETVVDSECYQACSVCGDRMSDKAKHTKGEPDAEDHCNVKCANCGIVLSEERHGRTTVNEKCEQVCSVCGDKVSEELSHVDPTEDAWKFDPAAPQSLYAPCERCGANAYKDATTTIKGLTVFGPDALASVLANARVDRTVITEETGFKYCRVTTIAEGEGTITLNDGVSALKGVGKYVAMLARRNGNGGGTSLWINSAGKADHNGAKTQTVGMSPDNTWQLVVYDFSSASQVNAENGIGWTRFDIDPPSAVDDYTDIAFIGFFDSRDDAFAYYGAYLGAYLGADSCAHTVDNVWKSLEGGKIAMTCNVCKSNINVMDCTHFDLTKLSNITAKENTTTAFYTADCALCGGTQVDVPSLTQEQGRVFMASELNALAFVQASLGLENNGANARYTSEYITNDGNLPYVRYISKIAHENCMFVNDGTKALLGVNKYVAVLYRKTGVSSTIEVLITPAGSTTPSGHITKTAQTVNDGSWQLAIIDLSNAEWIDPATGSGWTRIDFINTPANVGDTMDVAYVGFFSSPEKAHEHYMAYLTAYLGKENCCHSYVTDWTATEEEGKIKNDCIICGETVIKACEHISDGTWVETENEGEIKSTCTLCGMTYTKMCEHNDKTYAEGSTLFESKYTCDICGFTSSIEGVNRTDELAIITPGQLIDKSTANGDKDSKTNNGEYKYELLEDAKGFKYAHYEVVTATTGEMFLYINRTGDGVVEKTGPYVAILVRKSSGIPTNTDLFISANDQLDNSNVFYAKYADSSDWQLVIYNFTSCQGWVYTDGAGCIRLDVFNGAGIAAGQSVDIAYAGFFSSTEAANEFYSEFASEYGL